MKRSELKLIVDECYRQLGPEETANLVDGIKAVGFQFATRGGMTIGLWDIVTPVRQGRAPGGDRRRRHGHRPPVPARPHHRGRALRAGRRAVAADDQGRLRLDDVDPRAGQLAADDDRLRGPREQGQHRPARRDARAHGGPVRPDHRRPGPEQLPRGHVRPRVLHLDPRRPQGPRGHGPAHRGLGLPDPAARRRGPGRHHPRRGLRHGGGELDHGGRHGRHDRRLVAGLGRRYAAPRFATSSASGSSAGCRPPRCRIRGPRRRTRRSWWTATS